MTTTYIAVESYQVLSGPMKPQQAFFILKFSGNLLCYNTLFEKGYSICPTNTGCYNLTKSSHTLLKVLVNNNIFYTETTFSSAVITGSVSFVAHGTKFSLSFWNNLMGHPNPFDLPFIFSHIGDGPAGKIVCSTCATSESHSLPLLGVFFHPSFTSELVHPKLRGKISPPTLSGFQNYMKITYIFTSYSQVRLLKNKVKALSQFQESSQLVKTIHSCKIKNLVSERGGEYADETVTNCLVSKIITHQTTYPYPPSQNPVSEWEKTITIKRSHWFI